MERMRRAHSSSFSPPGVTPRDQMDLKVLLKFLDCRCDRWLRNVAGPCRPRVVLLLGKCDKVGQVPY
jgi:hypothetical protein